MRTALWIGSGALAFLLLIFAFRPAPRREETPRPAASGTPSWPDATQPVLVPGQDPSQAKPASPQPKTAPPQPKSLEELAKEAVELNLPPPPPPEADDLTAREYVRSLDAFTHGADAERVQRIHQFRFNYMREQRRLAGERRREEALKRPPEDPSRPRPAPLFPPPVLPPPVSGVEPQQPK